MIQFSPSALSEVKRLRAKHLRNQPGEILQIRVEPSGCAGLSYQIEFIQAPQPQDIVSECGGIQIAIAPHSLPYIEGLVVDYTEDLMGGGFRFHNPNATQTCGCGNSFTVGEPSGSIKSC